MNDLIERFQGNEALALGLTVGSVVMFVGSLLLVPWLVARAPVDYFVREHRPPRSAFGWFGVVLKNLLGYVLLVLGLLMLLLPGQGLLTVLLAVSLLDFPGKRALRRKLVQRPNVQRGLQWLRERAQKPPFELP